MNIRMVETCARSRCSNAVDRGGTARMDHQGELPTEARLNETGGLGLLSSARCTAVWMPQRLGKNHFATRTEVFTCFEHRCTYCWWDKLCTHARRTFPFRGAQARMAWGADDFQCLVAGRLFGFLIATASCDLLLPKLVCSWHAKDGRELGPTPHLHEAAFQNAQASVLGAVTLVGLGTTFPMGIILLTQHPVLPAGGC